MCVCVWTERFFFCVDCFYVSQVSRDRYGIHALCRRFYKRERSVTCEEDDDNNKNETFMNEYSLFDMEQALDMIVQGVSFRG